MKKIYSVLFILMIVACNDDDVTCHLTSALNSDAQVFNYTFQGTQVTDVQVQTSLTQILDYHYDYDNNGVLIKQLMSERGTANMTHQYFEYESTTVIITQYIIQGTDTLSESVFHGFYVTNPASKIYHDKHFNSSYKFSDGNLIEYGTYSVAGTDTTDTFTQRYTYDNLTNYYKKPEYRIAIAEDFVWARMNSKNNLIIAEDIAGAWEKTYEYQLDDQKNFRNYVASTGSVVEFGYACH